MPKRRRIGERYLLAPRERLPGRQHTFEIQNFIGQGGFAAAYRAVTADGQPCFIKEYFPPSRPSEAAELGRVYGTERDVVRRIGNYELIPRFWDAFSYEGFHYLVTDFVPGPDLETVLRSGQRLRQDVLVQWCVCLSHELAFLHSRNVVHHDLKPENVRLNEDGDPVIVDFSAAHWYRMPGETTDQIYGSDSFLAPEYADRDAEDLESGRRMDVFALGRILVEMMTGERMSQDEINRRQDQLYGQILHSGRLDTAFVRAVFRSVTYDPARRYPSGTELLEDMAPAAPPLGRVRPAKVDFGVVRDTAPRELNVQCYNVGGGTLRAEVAADGDWFEIGTTGAVTGKNSMFERNRQSIRVVAYPERVPAGGGAAGRMVLTFSGASLEVPIQLERGREAADVQVQPQSLKLMAPPGGFGQARLTFTNVGSAPARIALRPPVDLVIGVQPEQFELGPRVRQEVTISIDSSVLGDREIVSSLGWEVEGNPRPAIPMQAGVRRGAGILSALGGRLRKK
jgi:serine/threonine-protein kinase